MMNLISSKHLRPVLLVALALGLESCGGSGASETFDDGSSLQTKPDGSFFLPTPAHFNGQGNRLSIVSQGMRYGRMVDVLGLDFDGGRVPMFSEFVISPSLTSNADFLLETNPVTTKQSLIIRRDVTDEDVGLPQFLELLAEAEDRNLLPDIFDAGLDGLGSLSVLPRNAALIIEFNDIIDADTVSPQSVKVFAGVPPVIPFEARILPDANHGLLLDTNGDGVPEYHPSRIIIDPTVSEIESFQTDPPTPVNGIGLPASVDINQANLAIRIPTKKDSSTLQTSVLTNLAGNPLSVTDNGTVDYASPTQDVLRRIRTGGLQDVTGDIFNGFLNDLEPPALVGQQPISIEASPVHLDDPNDPLAFVLPTVLFDSTFCAQPPFPGDILRQPGLFAEVLNIPGTPVNGVVDDIEVRLILYPAEWDLLHPLDENGAPQGYLEWVSSGPGQGSYLATFDPGSDMGRAQCFVTVFPSPDEFPASGIGTDATFTMRFSEPMDPSSLTAFDSMTLTREEEPSSTSQYVVGSVVQSLDLQEFTFLPDLPLAHQFGSVESYYLSLTAGELGPTDLAGNEIGSSLPPIEAKVRSTAGTRINGGRVSRFTSQDEEAPFADDDDSNTEWTGQHLYDLGRQLIRPRPVVRFQGVADREQLTVGIMTAFTPGVQTPLSKFGSKLQTVWRHVDFGFGLLDQSNFNLDVEGLFWSPIGGQVISDYFNEFEIRLSHSKKLPDETVDPGSLFSKWPNTGLLAVYDNNVLKGGALDVQQEIVHEKFLGYTVSPGDLVAAASGTLLMPFPLNRNVDPADYNLYTWRDTEILLRAGAGGRGAEIEQYYVLLGIPPAIAVYPQGQIQTCGLPLLMEFRCYPDVEAQGLNSFDISLAINSSARPYFRSYSTGGQSTGGDVFVDPDTQTSANGGFNPTSNPPGASTFGQGPEFYIGAADFVVRVSRSYSIWFPVLANGDQLEEAIFNPPIVEPAGNQQPLGTSIDLHFRGALAFNSPDADALRNADTLNGYGDWYPSTTNWTAATANTPITFLDDITWKSDVGDINGANYYQVRATFNSNHVTGLNAELSALALSWQEITQ